MTFFRLPEVSYFGSSFSRHHLDPTVCLCQDIRSRIYLLLVRFANSSLAPYCYDLFLNYETYMIFLSSTCSELIVLVCSNLWLFFIVRLVPFSL